MRIFPINAPRFLMRLRGAIALLSRKSHEAHLQSGRCSSRRAARKELVARASRALADAINRVRRKAADDQLVADDRPQVQIRLARPPRASVISGGRNFPDKTIRQVGVDFEAAWADRRSQRGIDFIGPCARLRHRPHSVRCDTGDHSTPTGVKSASDAPAGRDHQNRHAIGRKNSQHNSRVSRNHPVRRRPLLHVGPRDPSNLVSMHLVHTSHLNAVRKRRAKPSPVRAHVAGIVADELREIQRCEGAAALPPETPEKSMDDTRMPPYAKHGRIGCRKTDLMQAGHDRLFARKRITYNFVLWNLLRWSAYERLSIPGCAKSNDAAIGRSIAPTRSSSARGT